MGKYDLERLSSAAFQQMAAALAIAEFPGTQTFGSGADGGRDMSFDGCLRLNAPQGTPRASGLTVFQVKQKEKLSLTPSDETWLKRQVTDELKKWSRPDSNRGTVPETLIFVTNVPLSPHPKNGGLVKFDAWIHDWIEALNKSENKAATAKEKRRAREASQRISRLKNWHVWDGNHICSLLDAHAGVRQAFEGFLTPGDIIAMLSPRNRGVASPEMAGLLQEQVRSALVANRPLRFARSGSEAYVYIDQIGIDLPASTQCGEERASVNALAHVIRRGDHVLTPSKAGGLTPYIVLVGAPGNGKSTLTRFAFQIYAAQFLSESDSLGESHKETIDSILARCDEIGLPKARARRWPFLVDLKAFATQFETREFPSLITWMAHDIAAQSSFRDLTKTELMAWLKGWPFALFLDGLDEVTEPRVREWVIGQILSFCGEVQAAQADGLIIATTRPIGYENELRPIFQERLDLGELSPAEAINYGIAVAVARSGGDENFVLRVTKTLRNSALDASQKLLLRTPLQVQIMALLAETSSALPRDRYSLSLSGR